MAAKKLIIITLIIAIGNSSLRANVDQLYPSYTGGYVNCPSWVIYLLRHKGYKLYKPNPPKDILQNGAKWGTFVTFPQKIEAIQARVGNIKDPMELLRSQDFLCMYKHPTYYLQSVLNYLADARYTLAQKKIALYAISKVCGVSKESLGVLQDYYQLYRNKKICLDLLELSFATSLVNCERRETILKSLILDQRNFLEEVIKELPIEAPISRNLKVLLQGTIPKPWYKEELKHNGFLLKYYGAELPFLEIIRSAEREIKASEEMRLSGIFHGLEIPPYFLMVMEHPFPYYFCYFNNNENIKNGTRVLRDANFNNQEKSIAIFGASQLCVASSDEAFTSADFIDSACEWYRKGQLSVSHLYELFHCEIPSFYELPFTTFYKYPFFILEYKHEAIQKALNRFIAEPTIPDGLKEIARKVKNGTLATKEEMAYMEGYRAFRKTHFTLYETISPN